MLDINTISNINREFNLTRFFVVLEGYGNETRKKYLLNQELDNFLWDNPKAIDVGFTNWKNTNLPIRLEAFRYHDDNCETQCKICEFNNNWRNKYERKRPPICQ
tara:strand:+ start:182 stop:493 length:312 start_codon:yes stop_codon:yes gene_type:complete